MPLSDVKCKNAKPEAKQYKLYDGEGLYLLIKPNGSKYWQMKYKYAEKEKTLSFGVYPEVSLLEARNKKLEARKLLRENLDPLAEKKAVKYQILLNSENNFKSVATEWHEKQKHLWTERHAQKVMRRLERDMFPFIGDLPINKITAPELLIILRKLEAKDAIDLTHRTQQTAGQIFRYAIATGKAERNIAADLKGAIKPLKKQSYARLKEDELPEFLKKLENYDGDLQTKIATKLLLLTFVRTGELRTAKWEEINFEKAEWRIPAERMKMRETHIVPLSHQVIKLFKKQFAISEGGEFIFPNRNKPSSYMSENTILFALYRMGYHNRTTGHGFRATASTILNENNFRTDVIERQLAHGERNKVRASYNYAQYLPERRKMMQWWADHIDSLVR